MKNSNKIQSFLMQHKYYFISMLLIVLYFFLIVLNQDKTTTVDIEFTAAAKGKLSVFLPDSRNTYSATRIRSVAFLKGHNAIQISVPDYNPKRNLRIDPDSKRSKVTLHALSFTRSGTRLDFNPQQISDMILSGNGLKWSMSEEGLRLILNSNDPMLILKKLPFSLGIAYWSAPLLFLLLLGTIYYLADKRIRKNRRNNTILISLMVLAGLLALYLILSIPDKENHVLLLLLDSLAALAIVKILLLVERYKNDQKITFGSAVTSGSFVLLIFASMYLSLSTGTISTISTNTLSAFSGSQSKGLNEALKDSRDAFEKSFTDNFYLKDKLLVLNAESKIFGFGFSLTEKAIVGKDNWFFEGYGERRVEKDDVQSFDNITDYMGQNPFTEKELEAWKIALEERYYWLKEKGSRFIFVLAPTKALVYPEKLPARILRLKKKLNKPTRYDQLISYLQAETIVPVVDLRKELLEIKKAFPETPLFYRTDFHWNYIGAFYAYSAIIKGINEAYPELALSASSIDNFIVREKTDWVHERFMAMVGLQPSRHKNDTYYTLMPKQESGYYKISAFAKNGISDLGMPGYVKKQFGKDFYPVRVLNNPDARMNRMFIIGDSFIEKTFAYFSLHSKETFNFRAVTSLPLRPFLSNKNMPEIVVQEILNMYLLKAPPSNPKQIRKARQRALEKMAQ